MNSQITLSSEDPSRENSVDLRAPWEVDEGEAFGTGLLSLRGLRHMCHMIYLLAWAVLTGKTPFK